MSINHEQKIRVSLYRPFCKQYLYYGRDLNDSVSQIPAFMPLLPNKEMENVFIGVIGKGSKIGFTTFITNVVPNSDIIPKAQWFPMYSYVPCTNNKNLFNNSTPYNGYQKQDNISDSTLNKFIKTYNNATISKEDIFYYIYGLLNSKDYQSQFFEFITKEIPRIPIVKHFEEFCTIGRKLANLHLHYENIPPYDGVKINYKDANQIDKKVSKIRFKAKSDKTSIIYNDHITIENIPLKAYEYTVSGKSPIEWILDRYQIRIHKESGIVNDPNLYGDDEYIFNLLLSIINVSIQSVDLINSLPKYQ